MWERVKRYMNNTKAKTLFAVKTVFSSRRSLFRWALTINVATLALALLARSDQFKVLLSKQVNDISQLKIPVFLRPHIYGLYSKYYQVDTNQMELPFKQYRTFSSFFTRKIKREYPQQQANTVVSPCDGKVIAFSEVTGDVCDSIKGFNYSLSELVLGEEAVKLLTEPIQNFLKRNQSHKLYQVVIYLAPGDYHRFHSPTDLNVLKKMMIPGKCDVINERALASGSKYEKNGRVSLFSEWKQGLLTMIMVGALNVTRIHLKDLVSPQRGEELGYFNLGSTIVLIVEAKDIKEWRIKQGQKIKYGQSLFEYLQ